MGELSLDPEGRYLVAFALSDEQEGAFVQNPNESIIVGLEDPEQEPRPFSIRSFGGSPRAVSFTGPLTLPSGRNTRFLVVRTDRDLALIDLMDLDKEEITIQLPTDDEGSPFAPLEVVSDGGDEDDNDDSRFAIRLAQSADVVLLQLAEPAEEGKEFSVNVNIAHVGGEPSAIDFARTDGGLRLAALIPSRSRATLVHPETTLVEVVELGAPYTSMKRITESGAALPEGGDVALLTGSANKFAFWSLGSTSGTPYRSVDTTEIDLAVSQIIDVPEPNEHLKVLVGKDTPTFYILDLARREAAPFRAQSSGFQVRASSDGFSLWVSSPGEEKFSVVELEICTPPKSMWYQLRGQFLKSEPKTEARARLGSRASRPSPPPSSMQKNRALMKRDTFQHWT